MVWSCALSVAAKTWPQQILLKVQMGERLERYHTARHRLGEEQQIVTLHHAFTNNLVRL